MFDDFVKSDTTPLYKNASGGTRVCSLLWGDGVHFQGTAGSGPRRKVRARGKSGFVAKKDLGGESLLEFYFIDVGQGDGILVKTPGFRHLMIDGGFHRSQQDTGKNGADFVDWKFTRDYGMKTIAIDAMLASHCDADHYGGLNDLLDTAQNNELNADTVTVEAFYHAGLSWWKKGNRKTLGNHVSDAGDSFWIQLLGDRAHAASVTSSGPAQLHGWWRTFIKQVLGAKTRGGQPTPMQRLSHVNAHIPSFGPNSDGEPVFHVLGPVEFELGGKAALRRFSGGDSKNTNGVSLLLRVDYGSSRILLTGDLNKASQLKLLQDYAGQRSAFLCDVAKACHHGSEDVSYRFLQAMQPAATIISSGDNEGHDHPRPSIIAASATTGFIQLQGDDLLTPLIYSTELARSIDLGTATKFEKRNTSGEVLDSISGATLDASRLELKNSKRTSVTIKNALVVGGLIYGLVNVRTDGRRILCATMDEKNSAWRIKHFDSRF